ncbi:hypothetical protein C8J57DRAFT_1224693 [Mycena rebaudengoi]|nr:hypothetical protein C8J57DRAFT_1224693 [Mycena rebaudengoi]
MFLDAPFVSSAMEYDWGIYCDSSNTLHKQMWFRTQILEVELTQCTLKPSLIGSINNSKLHAGPPSQNPSSIGQDLKEWCLIDLPEHPWIPIFGPIRNLGSFQPEINSADRDICEHTRSCGFDLGFSQKNSDIAHGPQFQQQQNGSLN